MTLDLSGCPSGSPSDMLPLWRRFGKPEARFSLVACNYMLVHQVIHRDLKLSNLFLNSNMNVMVGDFWLATSALIENPGERNLKKTIRGCQINYIVPEVLLNGAAIWGRYVAYWSFRYILHTPVVGHPPFQSRVHPHVAAAAAAATPPPLVPSKRNRFDAEEPVWQGARMRYRKRVKLWDRHR